MNAAELLLQDASAIAEAVRGGAVTATALVGASLERIAATDGRVNAFTDVVRERALRRAAQVDAVGHGDGPSMASRGIAPSLSSRAATVQRAAPFRPNGAAVA